MEKYFHIQTNITCKILDWVRKYVSGYLAVEVIVLGCGSAGPWSTRDWKCSLKTPLVTFSVHKTGIKTRALAMIGLCQFKFGNYLLQSCKNIVSWVSSIPRNISQIVMIEEYSVKITKICIK